MLLEDHGLIDIKQDTVFDVPADGAGEYDLFEVAAFADEVFDGVAVGYADYILLDDGTVVEDFGDVVAGRANQLYAALEGLMIWPRADERRQKRMVNVDDALRIAVDEVVGEDLHVAGEYQEVGLMLVDQSVDLLLGLLLVFFCDGDSFVGNFVEVGDGLIVGVI